MGVIMKINKRIIPFIILLIIMLLNFYLLPTFIVDTSSAVYMLIIEIPIITLICSIIFGMIYAFKIYFPFLIAVLFLPAVNIFFNDSAYVYLYGYAVVSLVGIGIGALGKYVIKSYLKG